MKGSRRSSWAFREADQWPRHRVITGFLDSRFSIWSVDSPSQTALRRSCTFHLIDFGGCFFIILGVIAIALMLAGQFQAEPWLRLWMAAIQSGTFILGGVWLHRNGVSR